MRLSPIVFPLLLAAASASAQQVAGFKNEYLADYNITSKQVVQLAEAVPDAKFAWRPGDGVRPDSETYVHFAAAHFLLLSLTGVNAPADYFQAAGCVGRGAMEEL